MEDLDEDLAFIGVGEDLFGLEEPPVPLLEMDNSDSAILMLSVSTASAGGGDDVRVSELSPFSAAFSSILFS